MRKVAADARVWLLIAAGLRLAFALKLGGARLYQIDESGFVKAALGLAQSGSFGPHALAPLVPAFFALFFRCLGPSFLFPRMAQALLGVLTAWIIGRMAQDLSGSRRAGLFALAAASSYPFFVYYNGLLLSETLYTLLATAGLWLACRNLSADRFSWAGWILGAFCLGLAALARPEAEFIAAGLWILALVFTMTRFKRLSRRAWAAGVLCWALPIAAWCARNKIEAGTFKLDDHGGITMLHGTLLLDLNEIDTSVAMRALEKMPFYERAQSLPEPERDKIYFRRALKFMAENPGKTLRQWAYKFVSFWRFYPRPRKRYTETALSSPNLGLSRAALIATSLLFEPWLILGGALGLCLLLKQRPEAALLCAFILAETAVHMISVSQMRYRLPVMPEMILGFSVLADRLLPRKPAS